jgi:hypothetical protein
MLYVKAHMILRFKNYFAFTVILLQLLVLNSGCSQQAPEPSPDLVALRVRLIKEYRHQDISIVIQNSNTLGVSFINSPFNELEEIDKKRMAQEIAVFVTNHFAPINVVDTVWVSFVTSETYAFVFQYNDGRTYQFDKKYLVQAGMINKPAEAFVKAKAVYSEPQNTTMVLVNNLQLSGDLNKGLILIPSFTIRGEKIVPPERVDLEFASYEERKVFVNDRNISIVVDNKSVDTGSARLVSSGKTAEGYSSEFLSHQITYQQFLQIVNGQEVELKLGRKVIRLTDEHLRLLREMKKCIEASECK